MDNITDDKIKIVGGDVIHITRVLRLNNGDKILVCGGKGYEYAGTIEQISGKEVICHISEKIESKNEPNIAVTLYQGIPKGSKMDYIIQKTTELGITAIRPVETERCVAKIKDAKKNRSLEQNCRGSGKTISARDNS